MNLTPGRDAPRRHVPGIGVLLALCFLAIGASLFYWVTLRRDILDRGDNPRTIEAELRIQRGAVVGADGTRLAESVGPSNRLQRRYLLPDSGPAVGYYSLVHGTAGIEEGMDTLLRGETDSFWQAWWRDTLHEPQVGSDVRVTLEPRLQQVAADALGDRTGALLLFSVEDNAVRAMVSTPGYDPNTLDAQFDALVADPASPLLNRATQGQYQPGLLLQPFVIGDAVDRGVIEWDGRVPDSADTLVLENRVFRCAQPPPADLTWADALAAGCPGPTYRLGQTVGSDQLTDLFARSGFTLTPTLPIAASGPLFDPVQAPGLAAIGQENLAITPLQAALGWGALVRDGVLRNAQLLNGVRAPGEAWQTDGASADQVQPLATTLAAETAAALKEVLIRPNGLIEHTATALSGPRGDTTTWYLGAGPAGQPLYALVVVLEESDDVQAAQTIGRRVLAAATGLTP